MARKTITDREADNLATEENIDVSIGSALRNLREIQDLTARQLAAQSGISAAMISRIENAQVSPSIATMTALTNTLDVPLASLFRDTQSERADFTYVKQGDGVVSTRLMGDHIHHYVNLSSHRRRDLNFEAHLITIKQQSSPPPNYIGHGVIFMHVLTGSARYQYGKQELVLADGDNLSIDAELSHGITEVISPEFVFLSVQAENRR